MPYGEERTLAIAQGIDIGIESSSGDPRLEFLDDLVRYAYTRIGSLEEAEDVAIEVLQDASKIRGGLAGLKEPKPYLLGMARRKVADHFRRNRKERGPDTLALSDIADIVQPHLTTDSAVAVREVLAKLPELYQEVLLLKYVHGLTAEEIARVIGKTRIATRSLVQRARDAFAQLGAHLVEEERA